MRFWLGQIAAVFLGCLLYNKVWLPALVWVQDRIEERQTDWAGIEHAKATLDELPAWAAAMGIELSGEQAAAGAPRLWDQQRPWEPLPPADPEVRDESFTFDRKWLNEQRVWEPIPPADPEDLEDRR